MAYTDPKTWTPGDVLTAADLNTYVRDNTTDRPRVRLWKSASQNINSGTPTAVTWDSETMDTDSMHDNATNNTRITIPVTGVYLVGYRIFWGAHADGSYRQASLRKNGTTALMLCQIQPDAASSPQGLSCDASDLFDLTAGDYLEVLASQASGAVVGVSGTDPQYSSFWALMVGG